MADEAVVKIVVDDKGATAHGAQGASSASSKAYHDDLIRALKQGGASLWAPLGQAIAAPVVKGMSSGQAEFLRMEAEAARRGMSVTDYKRAEMRGDIKPLTPPKAVPPTIPPQIVPPPTAAAVSGAKPTDPAIGKTGSGSRWVQADSDRDERLKKAIASTFKSSEATDFAKTMASQIPLGGSHTGRGPNAPISSPPVGSAFTAPQAPTTTASRAAVTAPKAPTTAGPPPPPVHTAAVPTPAPSGGGGAGAAAQGATAALAKGADAAGSTLVTLGSVAGAAALAAGAVAAAFYTLVGAIDKSVERYGDYSPEVSQAKAIAEINKITNDIRRANEYGNQLADYVKAKAEMEEKWEEIKMQLMSKLIPVVKGIMEALAWLLNIASGPTDDTIKDPGFYLFNQKVVIPEE